MSDRPTANDAETPEKSTLQDVRDTLSVTQHTATVGGETLHYTVTAGIIVLSEESEKN